MHSGKKLGIICLLAFALTACKKQTLQPGNSVGTPTFYFNGDVNGAPVNLTAGVSNYYMYSSYTQDSQNLYHFIANLHPINCNNCPNSIQFIINDNSVSGAGASIANRINNSLKPATYPLLSPLGGTPTTYSIIYTPTTTGPDLPTGYYYKFSDGTTAATSGASLSHTYSNPGLTTVALTTTFAGGHTDSIKSVIQLDTINTLASKFSYINAHNITFTDTITEGIAPYNIQWDFGDGTVLPFTPYGTPAIMKIHSYASAGIYQVTVTETDATGKSNTIITKVNPYSIVSDYIVQINADSLNPTPNPGAFSNITVIYTDGNGNAYSSAATIQNPGSDFQITTLSSYENNANGQTTKMLHVKFNCQLKDAGGQIITITNGDAVIAVAYK